MAFQKFIRMVFHWGPLSATEVQHVTHWVNSLWRSLAICYVFLLRWVIFLWHDSLLLMFLWHVNFLLNLFYGIALLWFIFFMTFNSLGLLVSWYLKSLSYLLCLVTPLDNFLWHDSSLLVFLRHVNRFLGWFYGMPPHWLFVFIACYTISCLFLKLVSPLLVSFHGMSPF